jgi:hypothetical protein
VLFLAHESGPVCFSVVACDEAGTASSLTQVPVAGADVRCNSLGLSGDVLVSPLSLIPGCSFIVLPGRR